MSLILNTAVTLHFLMAGFEQLADTREKPDILDDLGCGQDGFTTNCYDIAEAIEILNIDLQKDRECAGVYQYEAIEDIAATVLFNYVERCKSVPLVLEFIGMFKPLLEKWYEGGNFEIFHRI